MFAVDGDEKAFRVGGFIFVRREPLQLRIIGTAIGSGAEPFELDRRPDHDQWIKRNPDAGAGQVGVEAALLFIFGNRRDQAGGLAHDLDKPPFGTQRGGDAGPSHFIRENDLGLHQLADIFARQFRLVSVRQVVDFLFGRCDFDRVTVQGGAAHLHDDDIVQLERRRGGPHLNRDRLITQGIEVKDIVQRLLDDRGEQQTGADGNDDPGFLAPILRVVADLVAHDEGHGQPGAVGVTGLLNGVFGDPHLDRVIDRVADLLRGQWR
ncbi:hypothetical protein D3C76_796710 [compost metagenome]|nr:hypothetical protein BSF44_28830 [Pseudomonas sp. ACN8]